MLRRFVYVILLCEGLSQVSAQSVEPELRAFIADVVEALEAERIFECPAASWIEAPTYVACVSYIPERSLGGATLAVDTRAELKHSYVSTSDWFHGNSVVGRRWQLPTGRVLCTMVDPDWKTTTFYSLW